MKSAIRQLLVDALTQLVEDHQLNTAELPEPHIERTRDRSHGDFASNVALVLAKQAKRNPRELAAAIIAALPDHPLVSRAEVAGPGFINFFGNPVNQAAGVINALEQGAQYGRSDHGQGQRILVEFVSANPTGPLHVGHGRHAAYGASVANILAATGYQVEREYYVNDAGRQMDILAVSVWLRYLQKFDQPVTFPSNGYRGEYISAIAAALQEKVQREFLVDGAAVAENLPDDAPEGDKERYVDALIERAKALLGDDRYALLHQHSLTSMLDDIRDDLAEFGVTFDCWFSEHDLTKNDGVTSALETLLSQGHVYRKDGALWFAATAFGDDKDRVVQRANGQTTYFASDIVYIANKFGRGFDRLIYVWGADHHGTIARLKAGCEAQGFDWSKVAVPLVQFVNLFRAGEKVKMSTRSASFVTLRELRKEVGNDAARFFFVDRKNEQHLDFDLELATQHSKDNPVYYVQYAHARVCSVMAKLAEQGASFNRGNADFSRLDTDHEQELLKLVDRYPEIIASAAEQFDPQQLSQYLRELANGFHSYYNAHKMLIDDGALRNARLALSLAVRQILANGLDLLGVSAPTEM